MTDIAQLAISVDSSGLVRGERDMKRLERQAGRTETASGRLAKQAREMGRAFALVAAAGVAVAVRQLQQISKEADRIQKLTIQTGLAAESLQRLGFAAEQSGSSMEAMARGNLLLQRNIQGANDGLATQTRAFDRIGVSVASLRGMNPEQQFIHIADALSKITDPTIRNASAFDLFGRSAQDLLPLLAAGGDEIAELGRQFEATGAMMSTDMVHAAARFNDTMNRLQLQVKGISVQLVTGMLPTLEATAALFLKTANDGDGLVKAGERIAKVFNVMVRAAVVVQTMFQITGEAIAALAAINIGALRAMSAPLTAFINAMEGAANAIKSGNWAEARAAITGMNSDMQAMANEGIALMSEGFKGFSVEIPGIIAEAVDRITEIETAIHAVAQTIDTATTAISGIGEAAGPTAKDLKKLADAAESFNSKLEGMADAADGPVAAALKENARLLREYNELAGAGAEGLMDFDRVVGILADNLENARLKERAEEMAAVADEMERIASIGFGIEYLAASFHPLSDEMMRLGEAIQFIDFALNEGVINNAQAGFLKMGAAADATFNAMKSGVDRTSKEYKQLERAQQIVNIAMGIAAILQQGMGDPYTAIPRMAAMAAMVASLGVSAGSIGGGGSSGAAARQEAQGTGSILGDTKAQSESIINATQITASATQELVGINQSMLRALQQLQSGISGASGMLARGAGQAEFDGVNVNSSIFDSMGGFGKILTFDPITKWIGKWLGGKAKLIDEGIQIIGGSLSDVLDGALIGAFQTVKSKKWKFGKSKTRDEFQELPEELANQFTLIFEAITDSVAQAALALGISMSDIEEAINSFEIASQKISLMDLTGDEQEAALLAVFSQIFDGLAGAVVPFIGQFQKVGEGLGETLIRVATSVQVAQEAIFRLGLSIGELDPEQMAQVSVGLIEAAGGIERFISQMQKFISKFAPEAHKIAVAQNDVNNAFTQLGLSLPETRDGFWDLIGTIDATTEAGQQQIATLLSLADAADLYYSTLEKIQKEREGLEMQLLKLQGDTVAIRALELAALDESNRAIQLRIWALQDEQDAAMLARQQMQNLRDALSEIERDILRFQAPTMAAYRDLRDAQANQIRALSDLGASESQLSRARELHHLQLQRFTADLQVSILSLADQLFGAERQAMDTGRSVQEAATSMRDQIIRALQSVTDWLDRSLLGNFSPLTPLERLNESEDQFRKTFASAMTGDADAIGKLPQLADQLLGEASGFFGTSTSEYGEIFDRVREMMGQVAAITPPPDQQPTFAQAQEIAENTSQFRQALDEMQRVQSAWQLAEQLAAFATIQGRTPSEIADQLGFTSGNMRDILELLGHDVGSELAADFDSIVGAVSGQDPSLQSIDHHVSDSSQSLREIRTEMAAMRLDLSGLLAEGNSDRRSGNRATVEAVIEVAKEERETRAAIGRRQPQVARGIA